MDVTSAVAYHQPDIELFGIRLQEPITTLTDVVVAGVCLYAWYKLRNPKKPGKAHLYLRLYFLTMAVATFVAGVVGHGFLYFFGEDWRLIGWYTSMVSIMFIERSSIEYAKSLLRPGIGKFFLAMNLIELATLMVVTAIYMHFRFVEFHGLYGMLGIVFSFHLFIFMKTRDAGSKHILQAIGILAIAIVVFNVPIVPHVWFNHRDLAHVLMAIATLFFLKGALNMGEQPQRRPF